MLRRRAGALDATALQDEIARLRDENARLRVTAHRPLTLSTAAAALADGVTALVAREPGAADREDEAVQAHAEAMLIRDQVLQALAALQTAAGQLEHQLRSGLPVTEIDRRLPRAAELRTDARHDTRDAHERVDRRGRLHAIDHTTQLEGILA